MRRSSGPAPTRSARTKTCANACSTSKGVFGPWHDTVLNVTPDWIELNGEAVEVDVRRLGAIESGTRAGTDEILGLCRGAFLRGLTTRSEPFDAWLAAQRERSREIAVRCLAAARNWSERAGRAEETAKLNAALAEYGLRPEELGEVEAALRSLPVAERWRRWHLVSLGAAVTVLVAAVLVWFTVLRAPGEELRISAIPFTTQHGSSDELGLAVGVSFGVNYALYSISDIYVVTPPPVAEQLGQSEQVIRAKELGVRYLVTGNIAVVGGVAQVTVQCLDAETASYAWQSRFLKPYDKNSIKLQDDIVRKIISEFGIELSTAEWNRTQFLNDTESLPAYLSASIAVRHLIKMNRKDMKLAVEFYQKALGADPNYISAYRGLAWAALLKVRLGWAKDAVAEIGRAKSYLDIVLERRPDDGTSQSLKGMMMLLALPPDYDRSIKAGKRAVELLPGSADAWGVYAHNLTYVSENEKALEAIKRAMELSARDPAWYGWTLGRIHRLAGRTAESIQVLEQAMRAEERPIVLLTEMVASYAAAGRNIDARRTAAMIRDVAPEFSATERMGGKKHPLEIYRASGRRFGAATESGRRSKATSEPGRSENSRNKANQTKKKQKPKAAKKSDPVGGSDTELNSARNTKTRTAKLRTAKLRTAKAKSSKRTTQRNPNAVQSKAKAEAAKAKSNSRTRAGAPSKRANERAFWPPRWDGILSMRIAHWATAAAILVPLLLISYTTGLLPFLTNANTDGGATSLSHSRPWPRRGAESEVVTAEPQFGWWVQVASDRLTSSDAAKAEALGVNETLREEVLAWREAKSRLAASLADPFPDAEITLEVAAGDDGEDEDYEIKLCAGWAQDEEDPGLQELLSWIRSETAYSDAYLVRFKLD